MCCEGQTGSRPYGRGHRHQRSGRKAHAPRQSAVRAADDIFSTVLDEDGNGELDVHEFRAFFRSLEGDEALEVDEDDVEGWFDELDADGNGVISMEEFRDWWLAR